MAANTQDEGVTEEDLLREADAVSEEDLLREAEEAAPAQDATSEVTPPTPMPSAPSGGRTFYVRDDKGGFQPVSYENALRANASGLKVMSEAEVRAAREAPPATPVAPAPTAKPPPKDPGFFKSLGHSALSGFFKQGSDEATGKLASTFTDLGPHAAYRLPSGERPVRTTADLYRAVRDGERETLEGAREHYPVTSFLANMGGDIVSDAVVQALGVPAASTPYQVAAGALSGFLGSDADVSGGQATAANVAEAAGSTALGGALGYVLPKVGTQVARAFPGLMSRAREGLENLAIRQGRRVLLNGADSLAGNKELAPEAVREALSSGAIPAFGTTQDAYRNLETLAEMRGERYGDILERLQNAGVQGPNVDGLAKSFQETADDAWRNSGANKSVADVFAREADNVRAVAPPAPGGFQVVGEGPMAVTGPRLAPEPRVAPPAPAPSAPPSGPVRAPPLGPLPVRAAPVWTPAAAESTRAGRPRGMPTAPTPPAPTAALVEDVVTAPPAVPLKAPVAGPMAENLPLNQAERIKRVLQGEARWDRLRMTGLDEAKQQVSSTYRGAIEEAIAEAGEAAPAGSEVAELASEFLPVKQQLANTIAARDAAERGAAAAAKRRGISLTDYLSAAAAAGAGPAGQLLAAAGNNFARNRGTSAVAAGAFGGARMAGEAGRWAMANPESAQALGQTLLPASMRQNFADWAASVANRAQGEREEAALRGPEPLGQQLQRAVRANPQAFGKYADRLSSASQNGPESLALEDYLLSQSDAEYAAARRAALMQANGENPGL